jgi:hypothetical protein
MPLLTWLEGLPVSAWVAESDWGYPLLLSVHSMGMAIVVGLLLVLDLRVFGYAAGIPIVALNRLMPLAWGGFGINLISGSLLFASSATRLVGNWAFLVKMGCIVLAGLTTFWLWREVRRDNLARARGIALLSAILWLSAITCGRLIAYVMDHAILHGQ